MAVPAFPWLYRYVEDPSAADRYANEPARTVLRPLVEVSLSGAQPMEQKILALVDSGSEHVLAAPGIARAIGLNPSDSFREMPLGVGGQTVRVRFLDASIRLHPPGGSIDEFVEWQVEIGFVHEWRPTWQIILGQVGFFDRWTITMHRHAQALVVEPFEQFDKRFSQHYPLLEERQPPNIS